MNPRMTIPAKLMPFLTTKKRFKVAYGGRGACKSQTFGDIFIMKAQVEGAKIGCFREYQNSIEDSVHALLVSEIDRLEAPGYSNTKTHIDNASGGCFRFKGLTRAPGSVKSMFGFKYFWVEEAQFLSKESLKMLTPTLRDGESECWFSLNPLSSADPISQRFIEPFKAQLDRDGYYEDDLHLIVKINYTDNPWFPEELEQERQFDYETLPRAEYDHIWLGAYNDTVEGSIIQAEWFDAAIDAHLKLGFKPIGQVVCSHDPSDSGPDDKGVIVRHGSVITHADIMGKGDSADGMDWALDTALNHDADLFVWDCDGLGVSLKRQAKEALAGKHIDYAMFKGSEGVDRPQEFYDGDNKESDPQKRRTNKQVFKNKRAQYYWALRDRFFNTYQAVTKGKYTDPDKMISISSDIDCLISLKSEVCRVPKKHNGNGLIQIMSKDDMKRLKIKSPNLADSAMMSMFIGKEKVEAMPYVAPVAASSWMAA